MIDKSLIGGKEELSIISNIEIDTNLPKHKRDKDSSIHASFSIGNTWGSINGVSGENEKISFFTKIVNYFKNKFKNKKINFNEVKDFFTNVKDGIKNITPEQSEILDTYLEQIEQAKNSGQQALAELLLDKHKIVAYEVLLLQNGITRFIESDTIVKYYKMLKNKRLLKLVYVKNFVRIIPKDIIDEKLRIDQFKIFDNYVVLGFDKDNKMSKMTKKEIEKAKDPILFGVIKGSNRLYFIGEWEDEHCDLTLDEIYEKTNQEKKVLNKSNIIQ